MNYDWLFFAFKVEFGVPTLRMKFNIFSFSLASRIFSCLGVIFGVAGLQQYLLSLPFRRATCVSETHFMGWNMEFLSIDGGYFVFHL